MSVCDVCGDDRIADEPPVCGQPDCPARASARAATRIITVPDFHEVVLFFNRDGGADALVSQPGEQKPPIKVSIAPPAESRRIVVQRIGGTLEVLYKDVLP